ncbi:MAG: YCF48-related protein [Bacteroidales bacterium]|nr:YCF48-related protein [Bacteroidales bacterium]
MRILLLLPLFLFACNEPDGNNTQSSGSILNFSWYEQNSEIDASLRGIFAVNENVVWASGSHGTFLRTTDGGKHWHKDTIAGYSKFDFRDIEAFDSLTALVMGIANPAVILKTTDGGKNWKEVYFKNQEGIFLNSMIFRNQKDGFIVGDPVNQKFFLLFTHDGGETWEEIPENSRPIAKEGEYMFAASGTCIATAEPNNIWFCSGGSIARIFHSRDDGISWKEVTLPFMSGTPSSGVFSILFTPDENGYCIGGDYAKPDSTGLTFMFSEDSGYTWKEPDSSPAGYRSCIKEISVDGNPILLAVGREATSYSTDKGQNWKTIGNTGFYTLDVDASGKYAWAAGADGRIARLVIE